MNRWPFALVVALCVPTGYAQSSRGRTASSGVSRPGSGARTTGARLGRGGSTATDTTRSPRPSQRRQGGNSTDGRSGPGEGRSDRGSRPPGDRGSRTGRSHRLQPSEIPGGTALITRRPAEQQHPVDATDDRAFRRGRSLIPYYAGAGPYASYGDYAPYWDFLVYRSADDCGSVMPKGRLTGGLQLQVQPAHAEVVVDGCVVGTVDEFDSVLRRLRLPEGQHWLDIWAEGYAPLVFEVRIRVGETTRYPGVLQLLVPDR